MQIALQIRQEIECSGQTWLYLHHLCISLEPLNETALWMWNFYTEIGLNFQEIPKWRFTYKILIQIWRPWIARTNITTHHEHSMELSWFRITKRKSKMASSCRDNWETLNFHALLGEESSVQNRRLRFTRRNLFGLCRWFSVSNRSGKSKRGSNAVGGCRENCKILNFHALHGEESHVQNRRLRFTRRNLFGLCRWWRMMSRSGKSKRGLNEVSGCRDNVERDHPLPPLSCSMRTIVFRAYLG